MEKELKTRSVINVTGSCHSLDVKQTINEFKRIEPIVVIFLKDKKRIKGKLINQDSETHAFISVDNQVEPILISDIQLIEILVRQDEFESIKKLME